MEQNLGPTKAGVQESGWFFMKTLELSKRGVILTYSGDSPFVIRLVLGITNESASPSKMPHYVTELDYTPTKVKLVYDLMLLCPSETIFQNLPWSSTKIYIQFVLMPRI